MSDTTIRLIGTKLAEDVRDAVHIAIVSVTPAVTVYPAQHVGMTNGKADPAAPQKVGIIDPYLSGPVYPGEGCLLHLYPGTITGLAHVWQHPAFPIDGMIVPARHQGVLDQRDNLLNQVEQQAQLAAERLEKIRELEEENKKLQGFQEFTQDEAKQFLNSILSPYDIDIDDVVSEIASGCSYTQRGLDNLQDMNDTAEGERVYKAVEVIVGHKVPRPGWGPFSCSC